MKPLFAGFAETNVSLWMLAASPALWALHFLACYGFAALWCGRFGDDSFTPVRAVFAFLTVTALVGISGIGVIGYAWHRAANDGAPHDADTPGDRRAFMGLSTLLLSALSAVGVIYSALAAVFIASCE
jgi:hypothetical protein